MIDFPNIAKLEENEKTAIPDINIGTIGHVDHGKTSLVQALTGKWTDTHSEEIKRGITIRLGYADASFYRCQNCNIYTTSKKCPSCFSDTIFVRKVSFIDLPGHETLMATVLSGASLMDGALLVIAANEECPQPQTAEHLKAIDVVGIKNIIIVQNKIDLVTEEQAIKNYNQIKEFVKGSVAENSPIIPVSAMNAINLDVLVEAINEFIKPPHDLQEAPKFYIARSFDINKPGTPIKDLNGGVIGGSLTRGTIKKGDVLEIKPGRTAGGKWFPFKTTVMEIIQAGKRESAIPGGLVAIQTDLDPSITRGDGLAGHVAGHPGKLPPIMEELKLNVKLFDRVFGIKNDQKENIKQGDALMLTSAIAKTVGEVRSPGNVCQIKLKIAICAEKGDKVAISKQVGGRWHLIGYGIIS